MRRATGEFKIGLLYMFEPPWRHSGPPSAKGGHWWGWILGWAWAVSGLILGAYLAPSLTQAFGLANSTYREAFIIGVTVVAGFLVQFLGSFVLFLADAVADRVERSWPGPIVGILFALLPILLPFALVAYGLYRYFTSVSPDQALIATAFVGGLLAKAFLIPLLQNIITGRAFKIFLGWLRGNKVARL